MPRSDQRSWPARHKILTGLGCLFVFFALSAAVGGSGASSDSPSTATSAPQATHAPGATGAPTAVPTSAPVLTVSSIALAQQFDANKVTALAHYKDRIVQTSGIASNVSRDIVGAYYVAFDPGSGYSGLTSMQCYVSGPDAVTSVVNGHPVTVRGRIDDQTMGIISIKDCVVVR